MFDFWWLNGGIGLEIKGFDDMGYDKEFDDGNIDFGWFCWDFEDIDKVKFWRKSVDESAIWFAAFPGLLVSFCHPHIYKNHGISIFFRLLAEQITSSIQNYVTLFTIL